jgi:hypothetical protein
MGMGISLITDVDRYADINYKHHRGDPRGTTLESARAVVSVVSTQPHPAQIMMALMVTAQQQKCIHHLRGCKVFHFVRLLESDFLQDKSVQG